MSIPQGEKDEFIGAINKFLVRSDELIRSNSSASNITVNAGGVGVWVAVTACVVMLGMVMVGGFWVSSEFSRINVQFTKQADIDSVQDAYIHKLRAEQKQERP